MIGAIPNKLEINIVFDIRPCQDYSLCGPPLLIWSVIVRNWLTPSAPFVSERLHMEEPPPHPPIVNNVSIRLNTHPPLLAFVSSWADSRCSNCPLAGNIYVQDMFNWKFV